MTIHDRPRWSDRALLLLALVIQRPRQLIARIRDRRETNR